jgi:long-chain acyl-CoA synthetase
MYWSCGSLSTLFSEPNVLDSKDAISGTQYPIPSPTVLFLKPEHLKAIATDVIKQGARSWLLYPFAWRHKVSGVSEGFVTKESLWDRVLFDGARTKILGPTSATLRAVIVSGGACFVSAYLLCTSLA